MDLREQLQSTLGAAYTLERELGGGGMSRVFVAEETQLGRKVVVKVLSPDLALGVSAERFAREVRLAARLQDPHIVPVLAAGDTNGLPYYTMPFVEGSSLRARLASGGPLPMPEAVRILRSVAAALEHAHAHGVVHRDIKPENVLLAGRSAVVTDFGIAKALDRARLSVAGRVTPGEGSGDASATPDVRHQTPAPLTVLGMSLGTPAYMAPEQAAGDPATDHRADLYAWGVVAYELLAGRHPFSERKSPHALVAAHITELPRPLGDVTPRMPPALGALVMRCLSKQPEDRPQSAAELLSALDLLTSDAGHGQSTALLLGGRRQLTHALALYAAAFLAVATLARLASTVIGLPDWVFPGALIVMALGLPMIMLTALLHPHAPLAPPALRAAAVTRGGSPTRGSTERRPMWDALGARARTHVTWRRTTWSGVLAVTVFVLLVSGYMALRALGLGPAGSLLAAGTLAERERLLVADFRVHSADSALGGVVAEAVRTELGQSSVISVVPTSVVTAALTRMQREADSRLDLALALDVAQREGVKAVVHGELTPLGDGGYVVAMRLLAAETGDELTAFRTTIDGPRELIPAIETLSRRLRGKIGESLKSVRETPRLANVTTPSLEALRKYAAGARANDVEGDFEKAVTLLEEAVAIDTTFAMAYRKLGQTISNASGGDARVSAALAQAYRFRERLTERERLLTTADYYRSGRWRDRPRAAAAYEALLERDSLDYEALNNFALLLRSRREFARAEQLVRRARDVSPEVFFPYTSVVITQINQGKFAEAAASAALLRRRFPDHARRFRADYLVYAAQRRFDSAAVMLGHMRESREPAMRSEAMRALAALAVLRGRLAERERLVAELHAQSVERNAPPSLTDLLDAARFDILIRGDAARGLERLDTLLARHPLRSLPSLSPQQTLYHAISLHALAERPDRARSLLAEWDATADTSVRRASTSERHGALAEIALAEGRAEDALLEFRMSDRLPDGPAIACTICLPARLARAYEQAGMRDSAIAAWELYLATPYHLGLLEDAWYLPHAYQRLGELYEASGDRRRAAANYARFVDLWKDADPELQPRVAEARRRLARLPRL